MKTEFANFEAFWPHFLSSHQNSAVRWCHVAALGCAVVGAARAVQKRRVMPLLLGAAGFGALGVLSHIVFTGARPENFGTSPLWTGRAVVRLCVRTVTGSIHEDLATHFPA